MSACLLVKLESLTQAQWRSDDGIDGSGELASVANLALQRELVLVLPAAWVSLYQVAIPAKQQRKARQLVPFILEEQLAEELETLHFAIGEVGVAGVAVAVVAHQRMQQVMQSCQLYGLKPKIILSETLLLPYQAGHISLCGDGQQQLLRLGEYAQTIVPTQQLAGILPNIVSALGEADATAKGSPIVDYFGERVALDLDLPVQHHMGALRGIWLDQYHRLRRQNASLINLLQASYSNEQRFGQMHGRWKIAAAFAVISALLALSQPAIELSQLRAEQQALNAEMVNILRQSVPSTTRVVNPKAQLMAALGTQTTSADGELLVLLAATGKALAAQPELQLNALHYDGKQLEARLTGQRIQDVDRLESHFADQPVRIKMHASRQGDVVNARLVVSAATGVTP